MAMIKIEGRGEVSEETIKQALDEKFGPKKPKKPEFEPIQLCHLRIEMAEDNLGIRMSWGQSDKNNYCYNGPRELRKTIEALQSALDYINNK